MTELDSYKQAYAREKKARELAENLLDEKTRELYDNLEQLELIVEQLVHTEKMAALGQLSAGIAHEINNPVGYSYSNIETLSEYVADLCQLDSFIIDISTQPTIPSSQVLLSQYVSLRKNLNIDFIKEDITPLLTDALEGLERVKNIVNNLKKMAYKESDEFVAVNVNDCINDCLKVVGNELKYKMEVVLALTKCDEIQGQSSDLSQVLINLFMNSVHACGNSTGVLTISSYQTPESVIIDVQDNGKGIEKDKLNKIFDPFFTTKAVGEGTGLGLSISATIIKKHKGQLSVKSEMGKGTCFTITLPRPA